MLAYDPVVQLETFTGTRAGYLLEKIIGLSVLSVLTIVSPHTEPPPYEFLNLYGACLQAPGTLVDSRA